MIKGQDEPPKGLNTAAVSLLHFEFAAGQLTQMLGHITFRGGLDLALAAASSATRRRNT
jgi:hypothetical protein